MDKQALQRRYREERDKRLRPDGNDQYIRIDGQLSHYLDDPYTPVVDREPLTDHVTFGFVGGGFAGLVAAARLTEAGVGDVRIVEKGGDFGGTWYWNRYPGAMCDTASMVYIPLLEETGHVPSEKYAHGPEILTQCQRIGKQYSLYDHALFHSRVTEARWEEASSRWRVRTDRGDAFTATFLGIGTGPLHVPKLPGLPGIEDFTGHSFHTSRWDYAYTGGDAAGAPMDRLGDKRVAIIGTGATAVQCVPHLAKACKTLFVFQRTPSSVDVRDNRAIDRQWFNEMATPGWQRRWLENFAANQAGGQADVDLVQDGWTDLARRIRERIQELPADQRTRENMLAAYEDADNEKMDAIRQRCNDVVRDQQTAEQLKAWYRQLCKRPCFHDEYLQAFNQPSTTLIDTDGQGVDAVTPRGVRVGSDEYDVDCIIYASGFEVGTGFTRRSGFELYGRNGLALSKHWANGMRTLHGVHVHGFPNLFISQPTQGANLISNVPHNLVEAGQSIATVVRHAISLGANEVEVTAAAESAWIERLQQGPGGMRLIGSPDCTPGYYNNEGQSPPPHASLNLGYPQGPSAYFRYIDEWRRAGTFQGLTFR
ncbi:MAG: NAD(P)/FAD-dependent oxidoreductase [Pseudomonadota bacterium]